MRIPSGVTDQYIYFVAVDKTDLSTRETGLTTFTVYVSRNGGTAAADASVTINEVDATNMPGVYEYLVTEDMTITSGNISEEISIHITQADMAPVTRVIELYVPPPTVAQFDARSMPTADYVVVGDTIAGVTLVATATTVTGGATSAEITALDAVVDAVKAETVLILQDTADMQPRVVAIEVDTGTTLDTLIKDIPNNTEFEARSIVAADYLTAIDTLARVTLVDTTTTNTDMKGTDGVSLVVPDVAGTAATLHGITNGKVDVVDSVVDGIVIDTADIQTQIGTAGAGLTSLADVTLKNGAHGGSSTTLTLNDYSDFTGAAASNPNLLLTTVIASLSSQTVFVLTAGSTIDDSYKDQAIVLYDTSNSDYPSIRVITDYVGLTKTITIDSAPDFTIVAGDGTKVFVTAPGSSAPTVGQIRTEMDDNSTKLIAILDDTDDIGVAGVGLTEAGGTGDHLIAVNLPNQTMDITGSISGSVGSVISDVTTDSVSRTASKADVSSLATEAKQDIIDANVDLVLIDTDELQTNQGDWVTAEGFATPTNITAGTITTVSGNVGGTVAGKTPSEIGDAMTLEDNAITSDKFDELTAYPLKSVDVGVSKVARTGNDSDTLETVSDQIDSVSTHTAANVWEIATRTLSANTNLNDITVAEIIAGISDGTYDLQEMIRVMFAALGGKSDGGGTTTLHFRNGADSKNRITAVVDASGNRTTMTLDGS